MRYLKTQTLNRRAIYDNRVALDMGSNLTLATSNSMILPNSSTTISSPALGQLRYNTSTAEVEVYQGTSLGQATWRGLRFKESTRIVQQSLNTIDGYSYYYGPLHSLYNPSNISSNVPSTGGFANGQYVGQNIIVLIGNVFQIYNTNYTITHNPVVNATTNAIANSGTTTLSFASTSTIPTGSVVTGSPYLPANTTATVTNGTTVTINNAVTGGNIPSGTTLTFTSPSGYYLNFSSDPNYPGVVGEPITVLLGFDQ